MTDLTLIKAYTSLTAAWHEQLESGNAGVDQDDALATRVADAIDVILATQATTLAGCVAKARAYNMIDSEELAASLALDIIAIGS